MVPAGVLDPEAVETPGVSATGPDGVRVLETYGVTVEKLRTRLDVTLLA